MADKAFGVKDVNLIGASGTPTIESPNNLNINAVNVAISTDITVAGKVSLGAGTSISSPGSNILSLGTNSVERVRITSSGNVGIGTDNPTVFGTAYRTLQLNPAAGTGDGSAIRFMYDGGAANTNDLVIYTNSSQSYIRANGARNLDIMRNGSTVATFNANGIALPSGLGIDFSAASPSAAGSSSAVLDDYEEGTWTPTWLQTGDFTLGNATLEGTYTKIGRLVYITMRFEMGSTTSLGTGYVYNINGLPFAIASNTNTFLVSASNASNNWIGFSNNYSSNTTTLNYIQFVKSGSVNDGLYNTSPFTWTTGDDLRMSGSYYTA